MRPLLRSRSCAAMRSAAMLRGLPGAAPWPRVRRTWGLWARRMDGVARAPVTPSSTARRVVRTVMTVFSQKVTARFGAGRLQLALDRLRHGGGRDTVAVVQRRQRAGIEERVRQGYLAEAGGRHAGAEQRAGDGLPETADHRVVLGHYDDATAPARLSEYRCLVERLDRRDVQHGDVDAVRLQ